MKKYIGGTNIWTKVLLRLDSIDKKLHSNKVFYNSIFFFVVLILFSIILFVNTKTPMTGDDYVYSFLYQTPQRLTSFKDIFDSQCIHYRIWGGRSVVHTIAQLILFIDNSFYINIINSLAFMAFICLIYYYITNGKKASISILVVIFTLTWFLQPAFAETVLWITGSANYLWGTFIILLFLLPYKLYHNKSVNTYKHEALFVILMFLAGIIAGWTNENTAAAMIAMATLFILYYRWEKASIPLWMYSGVIGAIIGYIIMIIAPGNFVRAENTSINGFLIAYRTLTYTQSFVNYLGVFNLATICLFFLYRKFKSQTSINIVPYIVILFTGVLISIYIMVASPGFPPRAWFGTITLNIIVFGIILFNLDTKLSFIRQIKNSISVFCIIALSFSFYDAYQDLTTIDSIWKERMSVIKAKKDNNEQSVTFKAYYPKTKFGLGDTPYATKYISDYYDIDFQLEQ